MLQHCRRLIAAFALAVAVPAGAATLHVTTTADSAGSCDPGNCSLRSAIIAANQTAGKDTIVFDLNGTFLLTINGSDDSSAAGDLDITDDVIIQGNGAANTIISTNYGGGCGDCRVFDINPGHASLTDVTIDAVTIQKGNESTEDCGGGGGLRFYASAAANHFTLSNSTVTQNTVGDLFGNCVFLNESNNGQAEGGGILIDGAAAGSVTITNTTISSNFTNYSGGGIALIGAGYTATVNGSIISGNTVSAPFGDTLQFGGHGGGIFANATGAASLNVTGSTISGNTITAAGGGIYVSGQTLATIDSSFVQNNTSSSASGSRADGGGIALTGDVAATISNTTVSGNVMTAGFSPRGGGVFLRGGNHTLTNCTISGNTAYYGGGVATISGSPTITGGSISGNTASQSGGGVASLASDGSSAITLSRVTVTGNQASYAGGGLFANDFSIINASYCRISNNTAFYGPALGTEFATWNVQNNWWGRNSPAAVIFTAGNGSYSPWLQLTLAPAAAICPGESIPLTASFRTNSAGTDVTSDPLNLATLAGLPIAFSGNTLGTLTAASPVINATPGPLFGTATVTYTAGGANGTDQVDASVADGVVGTNIDIQVPALAITFNGPRVPTGNTARVTFTVHNNGTSVANDLHFSSTLPSGLALAAPANLSTTCSGTAGTSGSDTINLTGASLAAGATCTVAVDVLAVAEGLQNVTAAMGMRGCSGSLSAGSITVISPPVIDAHFVPATIGQSNSYSELTFTITNPNLSSTLTGIGFSDTLASGLQVLLAPDPPCGGALGASGQLIQLSNATVAPQQQCSFSVRVGPAGTISVGPRGNSVTIGSSNGGTGNTSNATLNIVSPPAVSKVFGPSTIPLNGSGTLVFTIANNNSLPLTGFNITDPMPQGVQVKDPNGLVTTCDSNAITTTTTTTSVSIDGTLAASTTCTVTVDVQGIIAGLWYNTTAAPTSSDSGPGQAAFDVLTVVAPPQFSMTFDETSIPLNASTTLRFSIYNQNLVPISNISFVDHLPPEIRVETPSYTFTNCGGTVIADAGSGDISFSGGYLFPNAGACNVTVRVTRVAPGDAVNTTGPVSSAESGEGATATATLGTNDCTFQLTPSSAHVGPGGGSDLIYVQTGPACQWSTFSTSYWLYSYYYTAGSGYFQYNYNANDTVMQRQATFEIGTQTFTLTQDGVMPVNFTATASQVGNTTPVTLSWDAPPLNGYFQIWRNDGSSPALALLPGSPITSHGFVDASATPGKAYRYAVRAVDSDGHDVFSAPDLAVTKFFIDVPLDGVPVKLDHLKDHRAVVNLVRNSAGLGDYAWADDAVAGLRVKGAQYDELVTALAPVWTPLGLPPYAPPSATSDSPIDAARFNALRNILK